MATRFYLNPTSAQVMQTNPGFAGWTRTTEGVRRSMYPGPGAVEWYGEAAVGLTGGGNATIAADATFLIAQFISPPMEGGVGFLTSDTAKCVIMARESATNDNINRSPIVVKVYSYDGGTLRATLLALGHYGPNTTEWLNTGLRNKQFLDGDALATEGYTTVQGDRLVIEVGGQCAATGGSSVTGTLEIRSATGTDLPENESNTTSGPCWFEHSRDITFMNFHPAEAVSRGLAHGLCRGMR